jgi:hypothetical protein
MTLVSCWVLDLPSLFVTPTLLTRSRRAACRQAQHRFVVQALRHCAATWDQMDAAVTTFIGCFGRLWRVPWENGYKEIFWHWDVNGVSAAGACQSYFSAQCSCGDVGSDAHGSAVAPVAGRPAPNCEIVFCEMV